MNRPYPWLPERTENGDPPMCQNCERYGQPDEKAIYGTCGHYGWLCGNWVEAKQVQLSIDEYESEITNARKGEE